MDLHPLFMFIPVQKISEYLFLRLTPGPGGIFNGIKPAQVITFIPEHDLGDPFPACFAVINALYAAGIGPVHQIGPQKLQAGSVLVMQVPARIALTAAAFRPSALEVGLAHVHLPPAVAPAVPDMKSLFLPGIGEDRQHPETLPHPVLQRRCLPTAAAGRIACHKAPFRCLDRIAAVAAAAPEGIPVFRLIPGPALHRQFPEPQAGQVFPIVSRRFLAAAAVDHARLEASALYQDLISAVAPTAPDNRAPDALIRRLHYRQLPDAQTGQIFIFRHGRPPVHSADTPLAGEEFLLYTDTYIRAHHQIFLTPARHRRHTSGRPPA